MLLSRQVQLIIIVSCLTSIIFLTNHQPIATAQIIQYLSENNKTCDANANECYVTCDGDAGYDCNDQTVSCPSGPNCSYCQVYCVNGDAICDDMIVYGHECDLLEVITDQCNYCAQRMNLYAPYNILVRNVGGGATGHAAMRYSSLFAASFTQNITVDCNSATSSACRSFTIHGETAQFVDLNCNSGSSCRVAQVYCPENSIYSGGQPHITPCNIYCENTQYCNINAYLAGNSWQDDLTFECIAGTDCDLRKFLVRKAKS